MGDDAFLDMLSHNPGWTAAAVLFMVLFYRSGIVQSVFQHQDNREERVSREVWQIIADLRLELQAKDRALASSIATCESCERGNARLRHDLAGLRHYAQEAHRRLQRYGDPLGAPTLNELQRDDPGLAQRLLKEDEE